MRLTTMTASKAIEVAESTALLAVAVSVGSRIDPIKLKQACCKILYRKYPVLTAV